MLKLKRPIVITSLMLLGLISSYSSAAQNSTADTVQTFLATSTPMAIAFILSVTAMKITAFVIGYLIVKLGHDTLIKGVSGDIDFGFSGAGIDTKLKSASPGAFFVLAGAAIIMWGLFVDKPISLSLNPADSKSTPTKQEASAQKDTVSRLKPIE